MVPGKIGSAYRLNPVGNETDAFCAVKWELADPVSVTAWFQLSDPDSDYFMKVVSTKQTFDDPDGFEVQYVPAEKVFTLIGSGYNLTTSQTITTLNASFEWHHIAMVANGTTGRIYLDGEDVTANSTLSTVLANAGKDVIVGGSATLEALNPGGLWHGLLDEVRVYGVALTSDQVQEILAEIPADTPLPTTVSPATQSVTASSTGTPTSSTTSSTVSPASTQSLSPTSAPTSSTVPVQTQSHQSSALSARSVPLVCALLLLPLAL